MSGINSVKLLELDGLENQLEELVNRNLQQLKGFKEYSSPNVRSNQKKEKVINALDRLLKTKHFDSITVKEIAELSGVKQTTILSGLFKSKLEIGHSVYNRFLLEESKKMNLLAYDEEDHCGTLPKILKWELYKVHMIQLGWILEDKR